jgi:hypothetical protein
MNNLPWLGNYQANTATPDAKKALARIHNTLDSVKDYTVFDWMSSDVVSQYAYRWDIVGYLGNLIDNCGLHYIAVINDHNGVSSNMFHKSVDFYSINDIIAFYAGDCEEPTY